MKTLLVEAIIAILLSIGICLISFREIGRFLFRKRYIWRSKAEKRNQGRTSHIKTFFRVTLVLSILIGIITPFWSERILGQIVIHVKFPDDWADMSSQQKQNHIDSLLSSNIRFSLLPETSQLKIREDLRKKYVTAKRWKITDSKTGKSIFVIGDAPPTQQDKIELLLEAERRGILPKEKRGLLEEARRRELLTERAEIFDADAARKAGYSNQEIISYLTKSRKFDVEGARKAGHTEEDIIKYLSSKPPDVIIQPGWIESSLLGFVGFASIWLIYLFIRWVIVAFIIGGFRHEANL